MSLAIQNSLKRNVRRKISMQNNNNEKKNVNEKNSKQKQKNEKFCFFLFTRQIARDEDFVEVTR